MIFETWITVRDLLLPAIAETHGTHNEDDVLSMLLAGKALLWASARAAIVTEIVLYPRMKVVNCWLGGGDLQELLKLEPQICAYARAQGIGRVTGGGRVGWSRVLKDYRVAGTYMYKDIAP